VRNRAIHAEAGHPPAIVHGGGRPRASQCQTRRRRKAFCLRPGVRLWGCSL
jgi:hypothetical protein